ncbi:MAG TPA: TMEM175 family protein [Ktedonobacterales bacterium]
MALDDQRFDDRAELVGTARLLALSDGIFAIAATLLVLNLNPTLPFVAPDNKSQSIGAIGAYVLSFVIVGTFWLSHHRLFNTIWRADARLLALNIAFLFFVSALPFVTAVLNDDEHHHYDGTQVYAGTLALMALVELAMWLYACAGRRLVPADLPRRVVISRSLGMGAAALVFATSIPIAIFVNADLAKYWWLLLIPIGAVLRRVFHTRGMTYEPAPPPAPSTAPASPSPPPPRSTTRA